MPFVAVKDSPSWHYIIGSPGRSILVDRYNYLRDLAWENEKLKVACHDNATDTWTKWLPFPSMLFVCQTETESWTLAVMKDVHRSVMENEIVIESDYPTYEENAEAARLVGAIIESKGFIPHFYYSGNKSVHIHVYVDMHKLDLINSIFSTQSKAIFTGEKMFREQFMYWLRTKMITCWDTNVRKFDGDLVKASHLIRAELSKNKRGYKTFLGYDYRDVPPIPILCNESNQIYPKLGKRVLSTEFNAEVLINEFFADIEKKDKLRESVPRLSEYAPQDPTTLKNCVKIILSDEFKKYNDGFNRAMFILVNELRRCLGDDEARKVLADWNARMGSPIPNSEIEYRMKLKTYTLSCNFIHSFLNELGFTLSRKC
jgi:hypothetical protein